MITVVPRASLVNHTTTVVYDLIDVNPATHARVLVGTCKRYEVAALQSKLRTQSEGESSAVKIAREPVLNNIPTSIDYI